MNKELEILKKYAHDYRDIPLSEADLLVMIMSMLNELKELEFNSK